MPHKTQIVHLWTQTLSKAFLAQEWLALLQLAKEYGWQPAGTLPPIGYEEEERGNTRISSNSRGSYYPATGQWMSAGDAFAFAEALERACCQAMPQAQQQQQQRERFCSEEAHREALEMFIQACKEGPVRILPVNGP